MEKMIPGSGLAIHNIVKAASTAQTRLEILIDAISESVDNDEALPRPIIRALSRIQREAHE